MKPYDRKLLRAAQQIHDAIGGRNVLDISPELPTAAWEELVQASGRLKHASRNGWSSQLACARDSRERTSELIQALQSYSARFPLQSTTTRCSLRGVYEDLLALQNEFDEVRVDLQARQVVAVMAPLELEEVALGTFEIRLTWPWQGRGSAYEVHALEPNRPASNDSITHPHVQDETLCEGEGRLAIRAALDQGRLYDFFLLVRQILETYNPGSAYVRLDGWAGVTCSDCGAASQPDDSSSCERCGSCLCDDCTRSCNDCCQTRCSGCSDSCAACDRDFCASCLNPCSACGDRICGECRTGGQCRNCLNNEEEENEAAAAEEPSERIEVEYDASGLPKGCAEPAVHAAGLGEAGLSA